MTLGVISLSRLIWMGIQDQGTPYPSFDRSDGEPREARR